MAHFLIRWSNRMVSYREKEWLKMEKDMKFGKYLIKNVPHTKFNDKYNPKVRITLEINDVLHEIIRYMDEQELTTYDYKEWKE